MSALRLFESSDYVSAFALAAIAQLGFVGMMSSPDRPALLMDISDEKAQPVAVHITPVPLLKLGSKNPQTLPKEWQRQVAPKPPAQKKEDTPLPSPQAEKTPEAIPSTSVADAAASPVVADAAPAGPTDPAASATDASAAPVSSEKGDPHGSPNGTETDPNKARAADMYRNQLAYYFTQRFAIKGKVPFEQLAKLHGAASVQVGADRTVTGFTITKPSGDAVFDAEMRSALQSRVGATLPPPPPLYPDMLGTSISVSFSCTSRANCE